MDEFPTGYHCMNCGSEFATEGEMREHNNCKTNDIEKQRVWRSISSDSASWYVWDIMEVMEEKGVKPFSMVDDMYTPTSDGGYILIQCFHFWTKKNAERFMESNDWRMFQTTTYVGQ